MCYEKSVYHYLSNFEGYDSPVWHSKDSFSLWPGLQIRTIESKMANSATKMYLYNNLLSQDTNVQPRETNHLYTSVFLPFFLTHQTQITMPFHNTSLMLSEEHLNEHEMTTPHFLGSPFSSTETRMNIDYLRNLCLTRKQACSVNNNISFYLYKNIMLKQPLVFSYKKSVYFFWLKNRKNSICRKCQLQVYHWSNNPQLGNNFSKKNQNPWYNNSFFSILKNSKYLAKPVPYILVLYHP